MADFGLGVKFRVFPVRVQPKKFPLGTNPVKGTKKIEDISYNTNRYINDPKLFIE